MFKSFKTFVVNVFFSILYTDPQFANDDKTFSSLIFLRELYDLVITFTLIL